MKSRIHATILPALLLVLLSFPGNLKAEEDAKKETETVRYSLINYIKKGGPVMYPIIFCSIMVFGVGIERTYNLRSAKVIHPEFLEKIKPYWVRQDTGKAITVCKRHDVSLSRILKAGLLRMDYGILEIEKAVEGAGQHEASLLNSNLRMLGAMANIAPMLGFLGTVSGMIGAFEVIATAGSSGNAALVASGISEALITTFAGLVVGIPALMMYHFFRGKVDKFVFEMEEIVIGMIEELIHQKDLSKEGKK